MTWQPIELAPKDGTHILVCTVLKNRTNFYLPQVGFFGTYHPNAKGKQCWRAVYMGVIINPTHWMPLPEQPTL